MRMSRLISGVAVAGMVALAGCARRGASPTPADLTGVWSAEPSHNGQTGSFLLEMTAGEDGSLTAAISLPAIDVWDYPIGPVTLEEKKVRTALMDLSYDAGGARLVGSLPAAIVPVHSIPLELRRGRAPERPGNAGAELPMPEPRWIFTTGGPIWAGAAIGMRRAYAGSDDGVVYAVRLDTGREEWRFSTEGAIRATPVIHQDDLLVRSDDGYLYRLDALSGTMVWKVAVGESKVDRIEFGGEGFRYDHYASAPRVAGGRIYLGHADGHLYALDAATGLEKWRFQSGDLITSTPAVDQGRVFFGSFDGSVYAVDGATGTRVWKHDTGAAVPSSPGLDHGRVVVGSRSYDLLALDARDGTPIWTHYFWFSWIESSPNIREGTVYVGSSDAQRLHALDASTGELIWAFDTGGSAWARPAVSRDGVFIGAVGVADYMVEHHGGLVAVERSTGKGRWRYESPRPENAPIWGFGASPVVSDDLVVVGGLDGRLYAFPQHLHDE